MTKRFNSPGNLREFLCSGLLLLIPGGAFGQIAKIAERQPARRIVPHPSCQEPQRSRMQKLRGFGQWKTGSETSIGYCYIGTDNLMMKC
jgi:hypothetical protein